MAKSKSKWFRGLLAAEHYVEQHGITQAEKYWELECYEEYFDDFDWGFRDYLINHRVRNKANA